MTKRKPLYGATIALGSFLLFSVEPMAAKQLLPVLGGSSAVWLTSLFFFQTMLLAAYAYVFWLLRLRGLGGRGMGAVHLALLGRRCCRCCCRSTALRRKRCAIRRPPSLSRCCAPSGCRSFCWGRRRRCCRRGFARRERQPVPYGLYALSNLSSLLALIAYPLWFESHWALHGQRRAWEIGFVFYAVLCAVVTGAQRGGDESADADAAECRPCGRWPTLRSRSVAACSGSCCRRWERHSSAR